MSSKNTHRSFSRSSVASDVRPAQFFEGSAGCRTLLESAHRVEFKSIDVTSVTSLSWEARAPHAKESLGPWIWEAVQSAAPPRYPQGGGKSRGNRSASWHGRHAPRCDEPGRVHSSCSIFSLSKSSSGSPRCMMASQECVLPSSYTEPVYTLIQVHITSTHPRLPLLADGRCRKRWPY